MAGLRRHWLAGFCCALLIAGTARAADGFDAFWEGFRNALLEMDIDTLRDASRLPVELRGELDRSPVLRVGVAGLQLRLEEVLQADSGLSLRQPTSNRSMVERWTAPLPTGPGLMIGAETARVGAFGFARTSEGWRLVRLYGTTQ